MVLVSVLRTYHVQLHSSLYWCFWLLLCHCLSTTILYHIHSVFLVMIHQKQSFAISVYADGVIEIPPY